MSALSGPEQEIAAQVFDRLVTPSGTKLAQSIDDLATYSGLDRETLEPVLEKLSGRGRILHPLPAPPDRPGATRYEIFHDRLAGAVLDWRRRYLEKAERERQVEAERRRTRRLRKLALVLIGVIALVAGVAVAMILLWTKAQDEERQANAEAARALAISSRLQLQSDPALSVHTALLAFRKNRTPETVDALRASLLGSHELRARTLETSPFAVSAGGRSLLIRDRAPPQVVDFDGAPHNLGSVPVDDGAISPDGRSVVTISSSRARLRKVGSASSRLLDAPGFVEAASFSPGGRYVVTFDSEGGRVWNAATAQTVGRPFELASLITSAALSRRAKLLVTGDADGVVRVWQVRSGKQPERLDARHIVSAVAISHDGRFVAASTADGAKVWGPDRSEDPVTCGSGLSESVSFSGDGRLLVSGQSDGTAVICDPVLGLELMELRGHHEEITSVSFTTDSRRVFTAGDDGTVRIWRVGLVRLPGPVRQASFDATGRRIVTRAGKSLTVWDSSGQEVHTLLAHGALRGASLSPGGTLVATVGKGGAKLWRVADGKQLDSPSLPGRHVSGIAFDRSGKRVVVAVGENAEVIDVAGSASPRMLPADRRLLTAAFSHDQKLVVAGSERGFFVWRLDGPSAPVRRGSGYVLSAEASRKGDLVVTAESEGAFVWKWETPGTPTRLPEQQKVWSAGFSPDGALVVAGSGDGFAQVADWRRHDPLFLLGDPQGPPVTSATFSPDGGKILLGLGLAGAVVYDCPGCGPPDELARRAGR
jgi:WD40 repeat protein